MAALLSTFFATQAPIVATQLAAALHLSKAEDDPRERAQRAVDDLDLTSWQSIMSETADVMVGIAVDSGHAALTKLGIDDKAVLALMSENATTWARDNSAAMVGMKYDDSGDLVPNPDVEWQITDSTRDMIRSLTAQAVDDGWSTDDFADALSGSYAFSDARAQTIARTETAKADVAGHIEGWKASDVVASKEWLVADSCCDECQDLDGEVVDLDEPFPDGGGDGPPLHPNCRCTVLPVLKPADDSSSGDSADDGDE